MCSLKIENQIIHCTYLMLLTTKLNKTKTINNIITWHEVLKLLKQEELLKITLTCTVKCL